MTLPTVPSYAAPRRVRVLATTVAYRDVHRSPYDAERQRSSASGWHTGLMHYAAKCGWPGVSERELEQATARARGARSNTGARGVDYLGSLLCFRTTTSFSAREAPSRAAVKHATERAGDPVRAGHELRLARPAPKHPGRNRDLRKPTTKGDHS